MNQLVEILKPTFFPWWPGNVVNISKDDPFDKKPLSLTMLSLKKNKDKPCSAKGCNEPRHISKSGRCCATLCTKHYHQYNKDHKVKAKARAR